VQLSFIWLADQNFLRMNDCMNYELYGLSKIKQKIIIADKNRFYCEELKSVRQGLNIRH